MSTCQELVQAALPDWSARDVKDLVESVDRRAAALRQQNPGLAFNDALEQARAALADEAEMTAQGIRLNAAKNRLKVLEGVGRVKAASNPVEGLRSLLIGNQRAEAGARMSASAEQIALANSYRGGLVADLARVDGGVDLLASGHLDEDIARALWQLRDKAPRLDGLDPRAVELARAIAKWQDVAKLDANEAGANIGTLDNYITRQSHDPGRISADRAGWEAMARRTFDFARMGVADADIPQVLDRIWRDLADGIHLKAGQERGGRPLPKGAGRKLSKERSIHFRDADAWTAYNAAFGAGSLREAVWHSLESSARATGIMRVLGPDHEANYQRIVDTVLADMKQRGGDTNALQSAANRYRQMYLPELDGSTSIPGDDTLASLGAGIRAVQGMASLGGSVLSSVSDLATIALGARYQGASVFDALGSTVSRLFGGKRTAEHLEIMGDLGVAFDSIAGKITSGGRFNIDDGVAGNLGKAQHLFYTLNLQNAWTDALRSGVAEFLSMNLARKAGQAFDGLGELKTTLGLYGIDAARWDVIRQGALRELDGRAMLTPSALDDVPDEAFRGIANGASPAQARRELQRQIRNYFSDQNGYMVLTPDAAASGALKMGTQRGTPLGEAVRLIMQFKTFPYAFTQRIAGREWQQNGWHGVARTILATSMFGYLAMTLKDLAKMKTPRDPKDPRTIVAALQQGGGAGLYSDLLFSQIVDRRFGDAGLQLFGPTVSDVFGSQGIAGIAARAVNDATGDNPDFTDAGAASVRFVQGNTPGMNLFYVKPILDYLVFWHAQEAMNPGSLQRMEAEMERRSGQTYLVSPSEAVQ